MKNITYSLIMTFLFGSFFPSYQAYANGTKHIELNNTFNSSSINDDLVDRLANSKDFEKLYNHLSWMVIFSNANISGMSAKELEETRKELEILSNKKEITQDDDLNISKTLGFQDYDNYKSFNTQFDKLRTSLVKYFPELALMNEINQKDVYERAIIKGNLTSKFMSLISKQECFDAANKEYGGCVTGGRWFRAAVGIITVVCAVVTLVCAVITSGLSAGATIPAWIASYGPLVASCAAIGSGYFLYTPQATVTCMNQLKTKLEICVIEHGRLLAGGVE